MAYKLYCFRDSGFSYKVALFLNVLQVPWTPVFVDYHQGGTRTDEFKNQVNIQGECPVLQIDDGTTLSQSAAILQFLADTHGRFCGSEKMDKYHILRWLGFDNHKFSSQIASHRYHYYVVPGALSDEIHDFVYSKVLAGLATVEKQLGQHSYVAETSGLSIADLSLAGYLLYPEPEVAFSISEDFPNIARVLNEIRSLPGFGTPDQLMPKG